MSKSLIIEVLKKGLNEQKFKVLVSFHTTAKCHFHREKLQWSEDSDEADRRRTTKILNLKHFSLKRVLI